MKKTLLLAGLLMGSLFSSNAQTILFEDSFETYTNFAIANIGQWTMIDVDGAPTYTIQQGTAPPVTLVYPNAGYTGAFMVLNPSQSQPVFTAQWNPKTGSKVAACFDAIVGGTGPQGPNNDWLISPQVTLGPSGNTLTFWAKSITASYGLERFKVGISTTGTAAANFTVITAGTYVQAPIEWTQYTYNLDAYAGQSVYISINCVSDDAFAFLVDDFKVTTATLGREDFLASKFSVFPNPATDIISITNNDAIAINSITITDLNGRIVKNTNSAEQINISDLSAGVYMMNIASEQGTAVKKIIKK